MDNEVSAIGDARTSFQAHAEELIEGSTREPFKEVDLFGVGPAETDSHHSEELNFRLKVARETEISLLADAIQHELNLRDDKFLVQLNSVGNPPWRDVVSENNFPQLCALPEKSLQKAFGPVFSCQDDPDLLHACREELHRVVKSVRSTTLIKTLKAWQTNVPTVETSDAIPPHKRPGGEQATDSDSVMSNHRQGSKSDIQLGSGPRSGKEAIEMGEVLHPELACLSNKVSAIKKKVVILKRRIDGYKKVTHFIATSLSTSTKRRSRPSRPRRLPNSRIPPRVVDHDPELKAILFSTMEAYLEEQRFRLSRIEELIYDQRPIVELRNGEKAIERDRPEQVHSCGSGTTSLQHFAEQVVDTALRRALASMITTTQRRIGDIQEEVKECMAMANSQLPTDFAH